MLVRCIVSEKDNPSCIFLDALDPFQERPFGFSAVRLTCAGWYNSESEDLATGLGGDGHAWCQK